MLRAVGVAVFTVDDDDFEIAISRLRERVETSFQCCDVVPRGHQDRYAGAVVREVVPVEPQLAADRPRREHGAPAAAATRERFIDRARARIEASGLCFAGGRGREPSV